MSVTLICPKCKGGTELRGMMDAWYLMWCPDCQRLWRVGLWTLLEDEDREDKPFRAKAADTTDLRKSSPQ